MRRRRRLRLGLVVSIKQILPLERQVDSVSRRSEPLRLSPTSERSRCIAGVQPVRRHKPLRVTADCQQSPKALFEGGGTPLETLARFESLLGAGESVVLLTGLGWNPHGQRFRYRGR